MSLVSLARESANRQPAAQPGVLSAEKSSGDSDQSIERLTKYIPTESLTLYVAALAASTALQTFLAFLSTVFLYWAFALLTPILFLILFLRKLRLENKPLPQGKEWIPVAWGGIAAFIAFVAWALAVPGAPYLEGDAGRIVAAFLALFISTILDLFAPFFQAKA